MTSEKLTWTLEADRAWAQEFESLALAQPTVESPTVDTWLEQVLAASLESGQSIALLYGPPAASLGDHMAGLSLESRAAVSKATLAFNNVLGAGLTSVGLLGTGVSIAFLATEGWRIPVTTGVLTVAMAGIVLGLGGCLAWAQRVAGHIVWSLGVAAAVGVAVAVTMAIAVRTWNADALFTMPTLALTGTGLAAMVVGWKLPTGSAIVQDHSHLWTVDQWCDRLAQVLRGRHHLPNRVVRRHVDEARSFALEHENQHPFDQFGSPEAYALSLTDGNPIACTAQLRAKRRGWFAAAIVTGSIAAIDLAESTPDFATVAFAAVSGFSVWQALASRK